MEPPESGNLLVINGMCPISGPPLVVIMSLQKQQTNSEIPLNKGFSLYYLIHLLNKLAVRQLEFGYFSHSSAKALLTLCLWTQHIIYFDK